mmetsp:Transcript_7829/g.24933  ORF Transcript_7829/g.24933 Transcript_7829/m.24933 type:complete len:242 (+) Transcript_7829:141-866(+)
MEIATDAGLVLDGHPLQAPRAIPRPPHALLQAPAALHLRAHVEALVPGAVVFGPHHAVEQVRVAHGARCRDPSVHRLEARGKVQDLHTLGLRLHELGRSALRAGGQVDRWLGVLGDSVNHLAVADAATRERFGKLHFLVSDAHKRLLHELELLAEWGADGKDLGSHHPVAIVLLPPIDLLGGGVTEVLMRSNSGLVCQIAATGHVLIVARQAAVKQPVEARCPLHGPLLMAQGCLPLLLFD